MMRKCQLDHMFSIKYSRSIDIFKYLFGSIDSFQKISDVIFISNIVSSDNIESVVNQNWNFYIN